LGAVRSVLADHPRLAIESLPAYAPVLNPVEHLWSHLKWSQLCNFAPKDSADLDKVIGPALKKTTLDQSLMLGFWRGAKLRLSRWHC